jgi:elongation factor G
MGELHLDVVKNRMIREFRVEASFGKPRVSYRETLTGPSEGRGEFARAMGAQQLYAEVEVEIEPHAEQRTPVAVSRLREGAIVPSLVPGILESLTNAAEGGGLYGYPLINVRIALTRAQYAETGSAEIALNAAAVAALRDALKRGHVAVLEPIMKLEVRTPEEYLGGIMKNLGGRRALVEDTKFTGKLVLIRGSVPLAEMFGYSTTIRSLSQGRASFNLEPLDYRPVPDNLVATFHQRH